MVSEGDPIGEALVAAAVPELKAFLRVAGDGEDGLLGRLAAASAGLCEAFTGQAMVVRAFGEILPASAAWQRLGRTPVRAIAGVEALGAEGAVALAADAYAIDIDANGDGWVRVSAAEALGAAKRVRVTYDAGLADTWDDAPEALRQGVVRLGAHLFTHRDAAGDAAGGAGPPAAVTALWRPWRRMRMR